MHNGEGALRATDLRTLCSTGRWVAAVRSEAASSRRRLERLPSIRPSLTPREPELDRTAQAAQVPFADRDEGARAGSKKPEVLIHDAMASARRNRLQGELAQIRQALAKLRAGTYGECVRCEERIDYARLRVRPETPFCVRCQGGSGG